jgi:hypothetical protein
MQKSRKTSGLAGAPEDWSTRSLFSLDYLRNAYASRASTHLVSERGTSQHYSPRVRAKTFLQNSFVINGPLHSLFR